LNLGVGFPVYRLAGEDETDIDRSTFTLADLVQWGINHPSDATDALVHLIDELREVSTRDGCDDRPV
jgi:hypothetical protein